MHRHQNFPTTIVEGSLWSDQQEIAWLIDFGWSHQEAIEFLDRAASTRDGSAAIETLHKGLQVSSLPMAEAKLAALLCAVQLGIA